MSVSKEPPNKTASLDRDITYYNPNIYDRLNKIASVGLLDKKPLNGEVPVEKLHIGDKCIYFYLLKWHNRAPHLVYPNQDMIAYDLGTSVSTVKRSIRKLVRIGLVKVHRVKVAENKDSNRYVVFYPNAIPNRVWFDVNNNRLTGNDFTFIFSNRSRVLRLSDIME